VLERPVKQTAFNNSAGTASFMTGAVFRRIAGRTAATWAKVEAFARITLQGYQPGFELPRRRASNKLAKNPGQLAI
jgi:hypothetical protein